MRYTSTAVSPDVESNPDELAHYGVLGMKWGVRKDPQKAYSKASVKRDKLQANADAAYLSAQKLATSRHIQRQISKGTVQTSVNGVLVSGFSADRRGAKAQKAANRVASAQAYAQKTQYKADKWVDAMRKVFSGMDIADLDPSSKEAGQKAILDALDRISSGGTTKQSEAYADALKDIYKKKAS